MRNLELKYRCPDLAAVRERALQLGASDEGVLDQKDVFFKAPAARLKLRDFGDGTAELISYRRPDRVEARASDYEIFPTVDPAGLALVLRHALGMSGVVRKDRHLFLYRNTRIHLDRVEGLGSFVELETVMCGQSLEEAQAEIDGVAAALGLEREARVAVAYIDLLCAAGSSTDDD
jgi:predicted adenylyl cyclase CyaB